MRRREFVTLVGAAIIQLPLAARALQPATPVIGFLHLSSRDDAPEPRLFHQGLGDAGYFEGRNVAIEYRWAQDQNDRMTGVIGDLVHRRVSVIVVLESTNGGSPPGSNQYHPGPFYAGC